MILGLFGGTFDPIHNGHLNLALEMFEGHNLDGVLFCPAHVSPLKMDAKPLAAKAHRRKMVALAIEPVSHFSLLDWEIEGESPSYTIDTVRRYIKENPENQLRLILGEDSLKEIFRWKEIDELFRLAPPLIGGRSGAAPQVPLSLLPAIQRGMTKSALMEISSTGIRERLEKKLYCGHLVPAKVLDYIYQNKLY